MARTRGGRAVGEAPPVSKTKLSITLSDDVATRIRRAAGPGRVSEWLNEAALLRLQSEIVDDLVKHHGVTLTAELLAGIREEWPS